MAAPLACQPRVHAQAHHPSPSVPPCLPQHLLPRGRYLQVPRRHRLQGRGSMREQEARRPQVPRCVKAVMPLPARPPRMAVSAATGCSSPKHGRIERWCSPARAPPPPSPPPPPPPRRRELRLRWAARLLQWRPVPEVVRRGERQGAGEQGQGGMEGGMEDEGRTGCRVEAEPDRRGSSPACRATACQQQQPASCMHLHALQSCPACPPLPP